MTPVALVGDGRKRGHDLRAARPNPSATTLPRADAAAGATRPVLPAVRAGRLGGRGAMSRNQCRELRPWFPFYAGDWLSDMRVRLLTPSQRGVYIDLLAFQWREGAVPDDPAGLALTLGADGADVVLVLDRFFRLRRGHRRNRRMEQVRHGQRAESAKRSKAGSKGAKQRWHGHTPASGPATPGPMAKNGYSDSESESDTEHVTCSDCEEGAVKDERGRILRCCDCPAGRERALRFAREKELEESSAARKAGELPRDPKPEPKRFDAPTGPTAIGDLLPGQEESA